MNETNSDKIIEDIFEVVSKAYGIDKAEILGKLRNQDIVECRHVIAYALRLILGLSFPTIGKIIGGRDHTTIMHACSNVAEKIENSEKFKIRLDKILALIRVSENYKADESFELIDEEPREIEIENENIIYGNEVIPPPVEARVVPPKIIYSELTEREKEILAQHREGLTLQAIARNFNLTRERIRQILNKALQKEVGKKLDQGFEIDFNEYFKGQKIANRNIRSVFPEDERLRLNEKYLQTANNYTSLNNFAKDVDVPVSKLIKYFPDIVSIIENNLKKKKERWSRDYIKCRGCETTTIPHFKNGYCQKCLGVHKGARREALLQNESTCSVCSVDRSTAMVKYGRDFYITRDGRVLCRGCFLQLTGNKLAVSRYPGRK